MEQSPIIGRRNELATLRALLASGKSEFVAVFGRRRVGKTFLIRSAYEGAFSFQVAGLANSNATQQLANFHFALQRADKAASPTPPSNWLIAFHQLSLFLEKLPATPKVVFIDELPWFDTPNSGFVQALEHFWNSWASARRDILLVVCGSAASWMLNKLINNKGGLHNRVTKRMKIQPFNLHECEQFLQAKNAAFTRYQIVELYMVLGGVPFYWDEVETNLSAAQNIENICFSENGLLRREFSNLFSSLFSQSDRHLNIVRALADKAQGLTRSEIIAGSGLPNSGRTTDLLAELEESGFVRQYAPFGKKSRNSLYQLVDFYTLFYLKFIEGAQVLDENNWVSALDNPQRRAWSGYAFEQVCLAHLTQIKKALGISGIQTSSSSWRSGNPEFRAQIDLVIDRRDQVINLFEMKFSINPFSIDKNYEVALRQKIGVFKAETRTRKSVFLSFITTFGLQVNAHSKAVVQSELDLEDLFRE
ncbi:MAG: AAA family ATPase [Saprospiraceae bacterium]